MIGQLQFHYPYVLWIFAPVFLFVYIQFFKIFYKGTAHNFEAEYSIYV